MDHFVNTGFYEDRTDSKNITDLDSVVVKVSSEYHPSNGAAAVVDGNVNTFSISATGDQWATVTLDLGDDYALDKIDIANRNDGSPAHQALVNARLDGATVAAYDDGVEVWSATLTGAVHQGFRFGGVEADEVVITGANNQYLQIAEVDIFAF